MRFTGNRTRRVTALLLALVLPLGSCRETPVEPEEPVCTRYENPNYPARSQIPYIEICTTGGITVDSIEW